MKASLSMRNPRSMKQFKVSFLSLAAIALAACSGNGTTRNAAAGVGPGTALADSRPSAPVDIVQTAIAAGKFKTLATALQAADLVATLQGPGPFTVFAPTDEAFAKLPAGTVDALLADKPALASVLKLHVASGTFNADRLFLRKQVKTLGGVVGCLSAIAGCALEGDLVLAAQVGQQKGGAVRVVQEDIVASNGIIHVIDTVLLNPKAH